LKSIKTATLQAVAASKTQRSFYAAMEGVRTMSPEETENSLESNNLSAAQDATAVGGNWLKLGAVAAVSVLAGGLAAAWWYRNTLRKLHQAEETAPNPDSGISSDDLAE
jgi:hypothetical protein